MTITIKDPDYPDRLSAEVVLEDDFIRIGLTFRFRVEEFKLILLTIDPLQRKSYAFTHHFTTEDAERLGRTTSMVDVLYEPEHSAPLKIGMSYFTPPMIEELRRLLDAHT